MLAPLSIDRPFEPPALHAFADPGSSWSEDARALREAFRSAVNSTGRSQWWFGPKSAAIARLNDLAREFGVAAADDDRGEALSPEAIQLAERIVRALPEGIPMPEFAAEPDGSVSLDWISSRTRMFSVSAENGDRLPYAWLDGAEHGHGVAAFTAEVLPARLLDGIAAIMKNGRPPVRSI